MKKGAKELKTGQPVAKVKGPTIASVEGYGSELIGKGSKNMGNTLGKKKKK